MNPTALIRSISLQNILSYGPNGPKLNLEQLNVFIGPNGSGKSNLIEALSLLAAAPKDLQVPIREGGGVADWLWKGRERSPVAAIRVGLRIRGRPWAIRYGISFADLGGRFALDDEVIETDGAPIGEQEPYLYYAFRNGHPVLNVKTTPENNGERVRRVLQREDVSPDQSILSQRKDPDSYPELTYLAERFERIRFYRDWNLGRYAPPRLPQKADLPVDVLLEDAGNLGLVLNDLENRPSVKNVILSNLRNFYKPVTAVTTKIQGGTVQIFFHEEGLRQPVPATRLSDGTLRYICLLTILCHPEPPPVVCIEEPELGLHPDAIPLVAKLLVEASSRTQLFVTTHSDTLVDALSDQPESIVVCERDEAGTQLRRLDAKQMEEWLDRYRLGELWKMGEIGGNPR